MGRSKPNDGNSMGGMNMKKMIRLAAAAIAVTGLVAAAQAEELKFASFVPPQHTITASVIDKLADGVKAATNGALTVRNYPGGELGAGPVEQYVRVVQGAADMAWGLQGYTSSQFPKTMIVELPGVVKPGAHGYDMIWNAYDKYLAPEYPGTKPLALWISEPNVIIMKDKEIRKPEDMAGLKIRVAGAVAADVVSALGATPVQMPIPQVYNALQTGLIDGIITGASAISDFKLLEVANSYTVGAPLGHIAFFTVMNQAKYDGLPDDQKAAIDANSGLGLSKSAEDAWNARAQKTIDELKADPNKTVIELDAAGIEAFAKLTLPVSNKVVADLGAEDVLKAMQGE
jgi:TRAP-type C4-dicarboxylate transport system substrate-binding protein